MTIINRFSMPFCLCGCSLFICVMLLYIDHISKQYGTQKVLDQVSFSIGKGEIAGFLGPNGAGKSSTMKIIAGVVDADQGCVWIDGQRMNRHAVSLKKRIGFLPENNPLYLEMYVVEYLEYVAGLYPLENKSRSVEAVIEQTGLAPEMHRKIGLLSKGYQQRVGIAQAIIHDPDVLILDEPASGLDPNQIEEIHTLLSSLNANKAILFSSHTLSEVAAVCTRVIIIHQGRIVADKLIGEVDDLDGLFKSLTR